MVRILTDHCDGQTCAALEARGWEVVDAEQASLDRLGDLAQVDFVIAGLHPDHYEEDLRRLAILKAVVSMTRWGWQGAKGPVFNYVSEARDFFQSDRVLIPTDGFYEFTAPQTGQRRKTRWRFTMPGDPVFWIAGIVKHGAFTMLTTAPGADIAPYHDRQVVVLPARRGLEWLDLSRPAAEILTALPPGGLAVERDFPPPQPAGLFE